MEIQKAIQAEIQKQLQAIFTDSGFMEQLKLDITEGLIQSGYFIEVPISETEACNLLQVKPSTLANLRCQDLPYIKTRPAKYLRSDLKKWIKKHKRFSE